MLSKVNIAIIRPFLCFHCLTQLIKCLNHYVIFISLLFRILQSLTYILFMLNKVNLTLLRQFLGLSKLIIRLNHVVFLISLLFRIYTAMLRPGSTRKV